MPPGLGVGWERGEKERERGEKIKGERAAGLGGGAPRWLEAPGHDSGRMPAVLCGWRWSNRLLVVESGGGPYKLL